MTDTDRIAVFLPALSGGGAERNLLTLGDAFADRGYDVDLVVAVREGPYVDMIPDALELVDLGADRALGGLLPLRRYLRDRRPGAMLSTLPNANVVGLWAARLASVGVRTVVREANMVSHTSRNSDTWIGRRMPTLIRWTYPLADGVVAVSEGVGRDLQATCGIDASKVSVVHNPVVTPELFELAEETPDHPWLEDDTPVVLAVGSLTTQKDYPTLLRAVARLNRERRVRLIVLGQGPEREALRVRIAALGLGDVVDLHGWVPNPFSFMAQADVLVLSSRWEGLPNVLVQAMACGTPVVSTDCPSGPRTILEDGEHGPLVPVGDHEALAEATATTLEDPPDPKPARQRALDFHVDAVSERYLSLLDPSREGDA